MIKIENITIAGGGTLGSQIAWQSAFMGFNVVVYDAFDKGLEASRSFHKQYAELFRKSRGATKEEIEQTLSRLSYSTNLTEALKDADLLSESIPEDIEIKKSFYKELAKVAPEKTIFTTNSSTTLPSNYASYTGRPEKFLALHFANGIWDTNIGEVMGHAGTDPKIFDRVVKFASEIGMIPIPIHKEQNGYILNSLLVPLLSAAQDLFFTGVSDFESIDKTWMISMGTRMGPFGILDMVGLQTAYNISMLWGERLEDKSRLERAAIIKSDFIDKGKMGVSSGEGFYKYPNPSYADPDFLK
ncbi:3-hydroxyacyl-CoA dehydrogenase [Gillisia sp. JM1]|uniref:3-hydroxyacyl-CoA dehydrogenase n=1 Tax=Gillisia sp. JM1 TaxID=1283286 RepID=UPI0004111380|nr:3-hydroxyacyl-CoA dehydrogenase [Gillisia sp. JM1]